MTQPQRLPECLDISAADTLKASLQAWVQSKEAVVLDGAGVDRITTPCVQLLLAAFREAEARDLSLRLTQPSDALVSAFTDLGLAEQLQKRMC